ncbi:AAA family ATPase [Nocardioides euryhalodurans]|uniref:Nuclease SbcCD subunit C n=1 Tax=Nocardioides euryhalodurans TaxID=2518370 RepID=A0A4P7GH69_9ACTN|nr:SMC family ATPase [Nocardioides euryhalodurans]QBR91230.1 SMC family ATPase [Nocardioides euryhalodurans]
MRLHELQVTAFGPFAGQVCVDFDSLSESGLFLLTGATGAGKTSVLDAVCFALYGAVPGDRQGAKRLRSDHAAPGATPVVSLEFGVAGRRFLVRRSPAWERPKRRGTGTTREQASVVLSERVDGTWQTLATRLDEAGHLVTELLGMTLAQFCQVQLLPQGRFQAFLRSESDERHRLLQRLFRTARFEDVEQWLRERRRSLRQASGRRHDVVSETVSRLSEASGSPLPEGWDLHDLAPHVTELAPWAVEARERALAAARTAARVVEEVAVAEATSRTALEGARRLADLQQRHGRARHEAAALEAAEPAHRARSAALDAARRATAVLPRSDEAERARRHAVRAAATADELLTSARILLGRPDCAVPDLELAAAAATTEAAEARARTSHVVELESLQSEIAEGAARRSELAGRLERLDARAASLPADLARARADEAAAARADDRLPVARRETEEAAARLEAGRLAARLVAERVEAKTLARASVDAAQDLRERWLQIQEQRLEGMAAEMATALAVGASCPVCGSDDHPHPARPAPGAPDLSDERSARRAVDDAEAERHARTIAVSDLTTRITLARERAGGRPTPVLERDHQVLAEALGRLEAAAGALDETRDRRQGLEEELEELTARRADVTAQLARLDATAAGREERAAALREELAALLAPSGHTSVADLAAHLDRVAAVCREAARATTSRDEAGAAATTAAARADAVAAEHGFPDVAAARAAALPALLLERLEQEVRAHEVALATATRALEDPDLRAASAAAAPDVEALVARHRGDAEALTGARTAVTVAEAAVTRLTSLSSALEDAVAAWSPVLSDLALAERLASLTDGTSPDNRLRMRLSAYVLAYRLSQVVAAANDRLARLFDHRYSLEHTGDRGVGESRGGLSLRVRDDWTGESRDPATLSGGETFVVSLALALGLADVIAHEAGGSELDTLFVDEGFGTLDAETLDQVMDTLDSLRDGGRVVGVVSHVAEMRDRIPTQLHVRKQRAGSTLSQAR